MILIKLDTNSFNSGESSNLSINDYHNHELVFILFNHMEQILFTSLENPVKVVLRQICTTLHLTSSLDKKLMSNSNSLWFFLKYPKYFISCLCNYYHLSEQQMERYRKCLDWEGLLLNPNILWSIKLMKKYKDYLDWGLGEEDSYPRWINENQNLPWSIELIEAFEDRWQWELLSQNEVVVKNEEIIEHFKDRFDLELVELQRKKNERVRKEKNSSKINPDENAGRMKDIKSMNWNTEMLEQQAEQINWEDLSLNGNVDWTPELLGKYADKLDWWAIVGKKEIWDTWFSTALNDAIVENLLSKISGRTAADR